MEGTTFTGGGGFIVDDGTLSIVQDPSENALVGTTLQNLWIVDHESTLNLRSAAVIENDGVWNLAASLGTVPASVDGTIVNRGAIGHSITGTDHINIPLNQVSGSIEVFAGAVSINRGGQHSSGTYAIDEGAELILKGFDNKGQPDGVHIDGSITATGDGLLRFQGDGAFIDAGGELTLSVDEAQLPDNAVLDIAGVVRVREFLNWIGGTVRTSGTGRIVNEDVLMIDISNLSTLEGTGERDLVNTQFVDQLKNVHLDNAEIVNEAGGTWNLAAGNITMSQDGGVFQNDGTVQKSSTTFGTTTFDAPYCPDLKNSATGAADAANRLQYTLETNHEYENAVECDR